MDLKTKKNIYLALWLVLGGMLGFLLGELVELYFSFLGVDFENMALVYVGLIFSGLIFAFWAGPVAWKKIYVEGIRGKKYLAKVAK